MLGSEIERLDETALARVAEQRRACSRASRRRRSTASSARSRPAATSSASSATASTTRRRCTAPTSGISVAGAVDVAREASDIILLERRLDVLHAGIIAGRRSFGNVLKYLLMGTSSNFGNMFSMAGAALFLPFLPMLPTQILLNNFLYDLAQITIPTDNVDPIVRATAAALGHRADPQLHADIGPVSSLYDFLTFFVLLQLFHFGEALFHTGWFLESLATQTLVLFVIRTAGRPWTQSAERAARGHDAARRRDRRGAALHAGAQARWASRRSRSATSSFRRARRGDVPRVVEIVKQKMMRRLLPEPPRDFARDGYRS